MPPSKRSSDWTGSWSILRDVEVICAVIVERKTTGAAQRLGISQPAVSRAIAKIEARLGKILFHREAGRLVPTADALQLYERSSHIFAALADLKTPASSDVQERLVILSPPTMTHLFMSKEVSQFVKAHPGIMPSFDIVTSPELPGAIAEGRGHLGLIDLSIMHSGVIVEPFLDTEAVCFIPEAHPLAARERITPQDLDGVDYVAINRRYPLSAMLDRVFAEHRVQPRVVIETDVAMLAADFVRTGLGVAVLNPFPLMLGDKTGLVTRPFDPAFHFRSSLVLPASEPLSAAARKFIDFLKERRPITVAAIAAA